MQKIRSVKEAAVAGKHVVVRADFNVPILNGAITDDLRIKTALPTLEYLKTAGAAQIIILAHLGRPGGKVDESLRLLPIARNLTKNLAGQNGLVEAQPTRGPFGRQDFDGYKISENIFLVENLRFETGEEANDGAFAQKLAGLGDVYVNEAFADSHRQHASIVGVPTLIPGYAGLRFEEEVQRLSAGLTPPPGSVALIGGAKFETKLPLISKLLGLYDTVLLGGALGNDLIKSRGLPFGASLISNTGVPIEVAVNERLVMPIDAVFARTDADEERSGLVVDVRANERIVDIGPQTAAAWSKKIAQAPFVLWNGPLGLYEKGYKGGTDTLAEALVHSAAAAVVGGGDTTAAIQSTTFDPVRVFISTGGGAMLDFLTHGTLPGIEALKIEG